MVFTQYLKVIVVILWYMSENICDKRQGYYASVFSKGSPVQSLLKYVSLLAGFDSE